MRVEKFDYDLIAVLRALKISKEVKP